MNTTQIILITAILIWSTALIYSLLKTIVFFIEKKKKRKEHEEKLEHILEHTKEVITKDQCIVHPDRVIDLIKEEKRLQKWTVWDSMSILCAFRWGCSKYRPKAWSNACVGKYDLLHKSWIKSKQQEWRKSRPVCKTKDSQDFDKNRVYLWRYQWESVYTDSPAELIKKLEKYKADSRARGKIYREKKKAQRKIVKKKTK